MVPFIMQNERELEVLKERTRLALPFMFATCALEGSPRLAFPDTGLSRFLARGRVRFAVRFVFEVTNKPSNRRSTIEEIGVFTIENGKILREEFFYNAG